MGYFTRVCVSLLTMLQIFIRLNHVDSFSHSFKLLRNNRLITKLYLTTHIHSVGKKSGAEQFILDGISEYEKRLSSTMSIQNYYYKTDEDLINALDLVNYIVICLDENGTEYTSREFSKFLFDKYEESGASIGFVIGKRDGDICEVYNR